MGKNGNITFLFGAGAEQCYKLPLGESFKRDVILCRGVSNIYTKLNSKDSIIEIDDRKLLAYNSNSILYQTIVEHKDIYEKFESLKKYQKVIDEYIKYKNQSTKEENHEYIKQLRNKFQEIYKKEIYDKIVNDKSEDMVK